MKYLFLVLAGTILYCGTFAQQNIQVQGDVCGQWDADTVFVVGNITIPEGEFLAISPGCVVQFNGFHSFEIRGSAIAIGNPESIIRFTVADTTGLCDITLGQGGWNRITIFDQPASTDSTIFDFCRFEYSKTDTFQLHGGAIFIEKSSNVRISNSIFYRNRSFVNGGAIYLNSSRAIIKNNIFEENMAGTDVHWGYGGAVCGAFSHANLSYNTFRNNSSTGIGGGCSFEWVIPELNSNFFENNFSALGGAFSFLRASEGGLVSNNFCLSNSSTFFGGAVALVAASPVMANNTFVYNQTIYGGGMYCNEGSSPKVFNSIFWGNNAYAGYGRQVFIIDAASQPQFYHNVFEHGASDFSGAGFEGVYVNCNEVDPVFFGSGQHPFSLAHGSPCIDQGTNYIGDFQLPYFDIIGNQRIVNGFVDIGAYEHQIPSHFEISDIYSENRWSIYYNSISKSIIVKALLLKSDDLALEIFDLQGKLLSKQSFAMQPAGNFEVQIPNTKSLRGIYVGRLVSNNRYPTLKFAIF
jgi:hypothetical protein